jgi:DNA-directed RNA polymerase subunit RPC12/RpoP
MEEYQCKDCDKTGKENFYKYKYQCKTCWNKRTFAAAKKNLDILIDDRGGACEWCGYNRCRDALHWHHIDPAEKEFGISGRRGAPLDVLRAEVVKCLLLCANCHAEAHSQT